MKREWFMLCIAVIIEIFWVIGLKHAIGFWAWLGTVLAFVVSTYLMIMVGRKLPVGTVYAIFVGLGTAGTVFTEITFFGEPFNIVKVLLILLLLSGVIGLKLVTKEQEPAMQGGES